MAEDRLYGHAGNDTLSGGAGADVLHGGAGRDTLDYSGSDAGVRVNLSTAAAGGGHAKGDTIEGFEALVGSAHGDRLTGNGQGDDRLDGRAGNDTLAGLAGRDTLLGGEGNDVLLGGSGNDHLRSGSGDDRLHGQSGDDRLWGGEGADVFVFGISNGIDIIFDFVDGEDLIDLSAYELSGHGEVSAHQAGSHVRIDLSDAGGGAVVIRDTSLSDLDAGDFLL